MWRAGLMWKSDLCIQLSDDEREELERVRRSQTAAVRDVVRAETILALAEDKSVSAVARQVRRTRRIVRKWGLRFQRKRLRGLVDAPRSGRPARFSPCRRDVPGEARVRAA